MWITRYALPFALALSVLLACLAPKAAKPTGSVPARELLILAQRASDRSYTYSQATAAALASVQVPRPEASSSLEALESAVRAAGFSLAAVGAPGNGTYLVARVGG